jgi:hypothetical protein
MPDLSRPVTKVYRASGVRITLFALVFLILLPFFVSLPVMLYQRVAAGVWLETWGLGVIAVAFTVIMLLILFELLNSVQARIEVGQRGVRFVLPYRRALLPTMFYRKREIPYAQMHLVELRREVYGGYLAPVMMVGARIIDKNGEAYSLGYVSEADVDPLFPICDIAEDIAARAGIRLVDVGAVRRQASRKLLGLAALPEETKLDASDLEMLNSRHRRFMYALIGGLVLLLGLGVSADYMSPDTDRGEQARDAVVRSVAPPSATKAR